MSVPPQLHPLVRALPELGAEAFQLALKSAALHLQGRDEEIHAAGSEESLVTGGCSGSAIAQVLQSCEYLLKQAGKGGGMPQDKMSRTLTPLGFDAAHVEILSGVLRWVKDGAPAEPSPATVPGVAAEEGEEDEMDETEESQPAESLHWSAIVGESAKLARVALIDGVDIDATDERGYTAYHQACGNGHADCVRVLLDAKCDTAKRNVVGLTGWQLAERLQKVEVTELLRRYAEAGHAGLSEEKTLMASVAADSAAEPGAKSLEFWTVKIDAADDDGTGKFTVYVVEVWGESKRLAVTHRRYSEFHSLRKEILENLGPHSEDGAKIAALPFAKKTLGGIGKNSKSVRDKRCQILGQWLNATLSIVGKPQELCRFLGLSPEFIGITIVKEKTISAYSCIFEVQPMGAGKGLTTVVLPHKVLLGIDTTGVQLFDSATREAIDGEGYPYHLIRSWSWHHPSDDMWSVVLTFGDDQKGFKLRLATDQGKTICGKMREFATSLAVNLRKESLEQMDTSALQTKLAEMQARLSRAQVKDSGAFKKHTKLQAEITAVQEVLSARA